ncbi:MAG TPA: hypothetical protein P5102_06215 [Candidatus Competibacteraceae bacterium]|nr:hypothetical protein [Candidatus Competibacteraceae bacterium]HSA45195.1 hypothetical protein [Candidatus Competibacteraceae bacterium]
MMVVWLAGGAGAYAEGSGLSQGSALSAEGASTLVAGSVEVIAGSPTLTVQAVNAVAEGAVVVLQGVSTAATVSVKVTPEIAGGLSKAMGGTVEVITEASGYALIYAGKMIAFIPNAVSQKLLHHAPHPQ